MKSKFLLLFLSFITGCSTSIENNSYLCYLGKMMVSSFNLPIEEINEKQIQAEEIKGEYYANLYFLTSQEKVYDFYKKEKEHIQEKEIKTNERLSDSLMIVYFILTTPKGYKAYKRDNIQGTLVDQGQTLLTDNFYYYASKPDIFYCQIDLKEDSSINQIGTYSFYYKTSRKYKNLLSKDTIRILYHID